MYKIGEITLKVGSGATPKGGETVYSTEGHPFVRSQNVGWGMLLLDDVVYIDDVIHKKQHSTELQLNDVLLNITGASIGRCAVVDNRIINGNVNQHVCIIRLKEKINPYFVCNFLLSNFGQKQIDSFQCGGNRQGLNFEQIKSIILSLPSSREQDKIAEVLRLIDERIATQSKIIEKLQSLIKGLASSLTSQGVPNTVIANCLECHSSSLQEGEIERAGLFPVYGASGIAGYTNNAMITEEAILIIKDGSGVGTVSFTNGKCSVLGTLNYLTSKGDFLLRYIYYALMSFNFEPYKTGMAIPHIYFKDYGRAKIWCPEREKQMEISNLLFSIEEKIKLETRLLYELQLQKSHLLGEMFI